MLPIILALLAYIHLDEHIYIIKKDKNRASNFIGDPSFSSNSLNFIVGFNNSAIYDSNTNKNNHINKIFGFADCGSNHKENSARFGWRWDANENKVAIYSYTRIDGIHYHEFIGFAEINRLYPYYLSIAPDNENYVFKFNNITKIVARASNCNKTGPYTLGPYFGGDDAAPHDIKIRIKKIKKENLEYSSNTPNGANEENNNFDFYEQDYFSPCFVEPAYPNPSRSIFNLPILLYSDNENIAVEIFNINNSLVMRYPYDGFISITGDTTLNLDLSLLPSGMYLYKVINKDGKISLSTDFKILQKIIKL